MGTAQQSDLELMERFREGDRLAFRAMFERFYRELCYFSASMTNSPEKSEELVSETMTKLFERHQNFESVANVKAFLYISTRNACMNFLQSKEYKDLQKYKSIEAADEAGEDSLMSRMSEIELLKIIRREVESLPEQQRVIFKLFYFDELSVAEIAQKMNLSPSTVKNLKFIAVQKLRVLFSKSGLLTVAHVSASLLLH